MILSQFLGKTKNDKFNPSIYKSINSNGTDLQSGNLCLHEQYIPNKLSLNNTKNKEFTYLKEICMITYVIDLGKKKIVTINPVVSIDKKEKIAEIKKVGTNFISNNSGLTWMSTYSEYSDDGKVIFDEKTEEDDLKYSSCDKIQLIELKDIDQNNGRIFVENNKIIEDNGQYNPKSERIVEFMESPSWCIINNNNI